MNDSNDKTARCLFCGMFMKDREKKIDISISEWEISVNKPCQRCTVSVMAQVVVHLSGAKDGAAWLEERPGFGSPISDIDEFLDKVRAEAMKEAAEWLLISIDGLHRKIQRAQSSAEGQR